MSQRLELPEEIYQALLDAARASGQTPVGWIAERVLGSRPNVSAEQRQQANARLRQFRVTTGRATGIDNEEIDADLAREYGDSHNGR